MPRAHKAGTGSPIAFAPPSADTSGVNSPAPVRVGFVGLGTMGLPMARNLARAGFPLTVTSRTLAKAEELAREMRGGPASVTAARRPSDVAAASDVVVSCVPDAPEVEEVHLGSAGTIQGARPGMIVIDCSTIAAGAARSIAARLQVAEVAFLDAPVSGGQKGAVEGTLTFFVGGEEEAITRARPVFDAMGKRLTHLGPSGAGQLGKATNQVIVAGNLLAAAEGIAFAQAAGLPLEALHRALTAGAATSWVLEVLGKKMLDRDFLPAFAVKHQQKDLAIVLDSARKNGVPLPGVALVHQLLSSLEASGEGEKGTQALLTVYERLSPSVRGTRS